jgi:CTP:molybdopterin cytidylyltransferase MocA
MKKTAKKTAKKPAVRRTGAPAAARAAAPVSVVILAAGQGKRMRSDLPKVLQPLAGRPLLQHVLDAARAARARGHARGLRPWRRHGAPPMHGPSAAKPVTWVLQAEQLGTGHARLQAMRYADESPGAGAVRRCAADRAPRRCATLIDACRRGQDLAC